MTQVGDGVPSTLAGLDRLVAVFDLDGTITSRDTYLAFLRFVLRRRLIRLLPCLLLVPAVAAFKCGLLSRHAMKQAFLHAVLGRTSHRLAAEMAGLFVVLAMTGLVKKDAAARIEWHRKRGDLLVLATASPDVYATALGGALGFAHVLATKIEWRDGKVSGRLAGPNLIAGYKAMAVKDLLLACHEDRPRLLAYSDHHSDIPLLELADIAVAVDPTAILERFAQKNGMAIERWGK